MAQDSSQCVHFRITLPMCRVMIDVGDLGTPPLSILRTSPVTVVFPGTSSTSLAPNVILCLPLSLLPSILPRKPYFSRHSCLSRCPSNFSCFFLTTFNNSLFTPAISITLSFVILAVHGSLSVILRNHISTASILLFKVFSNDQASHSYSRTDQMIHFRTRTLIFMPRFILLLKLFLAIPIRFCTSVLHLTSSVTTTPRYL